MVWPIPRGGGARKRSLQARNFGGWSYTSNMEWGEPQILFQLKYFVNVLWTIRINKGTLFFPHESFLMRSPNEKLFLKDESSELFVGTL